MEMQPDGEPHWEFVSPQVTQAVVQARNKAIAEFEDDGVLYLTASDPEVQEALLGVADYYLTRYQVQIAVVPTGGRPVEFAELEGEYVGDGTVRMAGNAHVGIWCAGSQCSNPAYDVDIQLDPELWQENGPRLNWLVLSHEVGHIISGWGKCYDGPKDDTGAHLLTPGHLMSPITSPNSHWDATDDDLLCSCGAC